MKTMQKPACTLEIGDKIVFDNRYTSKRRTAVVIRDVMVSARSGRVYVKIKRDRTAWLSYPPTKFVEVVLCNKK